MNDVPVIAVHGLVCARVVAGISSTIEIPALGAERGSVTVLAGPVGCGKNLLLRVLGLLEAPDKGEVTFEGKPTSRLRDEERGQLRSRRCGYVFDSPFLLSAFTVIENIAMPLFKVCSMEPEEARDRTEEMLNFTGLQHVATVRDVSPAIQRRVALARALASHPAALFVENLALGDPEAESFRDLLSQAAEKFNVAVVVSVISAGAPRRAERHLHLSEGRLVPELAT